MLYFVQHLKAAIFPPSSQQWGPSLAWATWRSAWTDCRTFTVTLQNCDPQKIVTPNKFWTLKKFDPQKMLTLESLVVTMFAWHLESLPGTHFAQTNSPRLRTHHSVYIIYFWSPCISYTFDHPVLGQVNNNNNMLSNELEREKERETLHISNVTQSLSYKI